MPTKLFSYCVLPLLLFLGNSSGNSAAPAPGKNSESESGILEKMIAGNGKVAMDLDLDRLNGGGHETKEPRLDTLRFQIGPNSFFTVLVFNNILRGPEQGSIGLLPENTAAVPGRLQSSLHQLVLEKLDAEALFDLAVRDGKTGFVFFNIEGNLYEYDAAGRLLTIKAGRLLISEDFARELGRPADAGVAVGRISIATSMYPIEITTLVHGAVESSTLPPARREGSPHVPNSVPGPDVIVGDLTSTQQFGSNATQVGVSVGTTSCNNGDQGLNWFAMPNTDHPVIPQNLYRMSGGASNDERFEQIGQSWLKHAFAAVNGNACGFGCSSSGGGLRPGCSDPYGASLNASQNGLGSRAWVNPFTGAFPSSARDHTGHNDSTSAPTHRALVEMTDLNTTLNPGAIYYAEAQYVTPHEYAWCQSHPGQCNMYNNASYRRFNVTGTTSFTFAAVGSTVRMTPAIHAWPGATINTIEPAPGVDGRAFIAYKVTNPSPGVWHYEYAINNQNLDRSIQSFSIPLGCGITLTNVGFHAPLNHPGIANDGTQNSAGYSNAAWTSNQTTDAISWSTETLAQNENANAIRWGTLYNFRFDSDRGPMPVEATIGYFKTGTPTTIVIAAPNACNVTPSPIPTVTPVPTPTVTPPATPSPLPTITPTPGATPPPTPCGTTTFTNTAAINIPDFGAAAPYPSNIPVALGGAITRVTVRLNNLGHSFPGDIDIMLVGPGGQNAVIMSDVGGGTPVAGVTLTLDDAAATNLPSPLVTGTFKPTNVGTGDLWPAPAPSPSGGSALGVFNGLNPTGTWSLYVVDGAGGDSGSFAGGWELTISTTNDCGTPTPTPTPSATPVTTPTSTPIATSTPTPPVTTPTPPASTPTPTPPVPTPTPTPPSPTPPPTPTPTPPASTPTPPAPTPTSTPTPPAPTATPSPIPAAQAINLSTRMRVQTGDNAGIGGFIINGGGLKHVLIRAIGPSLAQFGVPNVLADPVLELHGPGSFVTITNDNWRQTQEVEIQATGIPPSNNLEAAIDATLPAGAYTAIVRGNGNGTGVSLIEVYDIDSSIGSKLDNISTRALISTDDNIVIAGFMLGQGGTDKVVLRGIGPSLTSSGVPNALADPTLELHDGNGALLMANNDWQDDAMPASELMFYGLAPSNDLESAIVANLPPGLYTALLAGRNNGSGIGLVEVYDGVGQ